MHGLDVLGLGIDASGVALCPDPGDTILKTSRVDEGTREDLVAHVLLDGVTLPGKEALIHACAAPEHGAVRRDLVAMREQHQIVGDGAFGAVAPDRHVLCSEDGEPVHQDFGPDLLEHPYHEVGDDYPHEEHVSILARGRDQGRKSHVNDIEQCEGVLRHDLSHAFGLHVGIYVHSSVGDALGDLDGGEPPGRLVSRAPCHESTPPVPMAVPFYRTLPTRRACTRRPQIQRAVISGVMYNGALRGPIAQWIRAFASGAKGRGFEPHWGHHLAASRSRSTDAADPPRR